jgi:SHS family sialic acid transporter-like MFS transporter
VFFIILFVPESEKWKASVKKSTVQPVREIFGPLLRKRTLLAILFASVALIGTWGSVQWCPSWADQMAGKTYPGAKADTQVMQAFGAIVGCLIAPLLGARIGRRGSYFLLCSASLVLCAIVFRTFTQFNHAFLVMMFFISAATASFYGWFPLYFPELFPTRVRATGQGLAYNFGRIFAAGGALVQGELVRSFGGSYARAGAVVTLVYLIGMICIWFAPETKGKPLPE